MALFAKPRSRTAAGTKVQCRKSADKFDFEPDATAKLIRKHLPRLEGAIAETTTIDRKRLQGLSDAQLKKIGVTRTRGAENVTVSRLRDDLDERLERVRPWL